MIVAVVAMLYSIYAIYASGGDAVLGGTVALGIGFIIWGFIAPRFASETQPIAVPRTAGGVTVARVTDERRTTMTRVRSAARPQRRVRIASCAIAMLAVVTMAPARTVAATARRLDQIRQAGRLRLGYRTDARPLSFRDESGNPAGYSVALCQQIAEAIKAATRPAAARRSSGCR